MPIVPRKLTAAPPKQPTLADALAGLKLQGERQAKLEQALAHACGTIGLQGERLALLEKALAEVSAVASLTGQQADTLGELAKVQDERLAALESQLARQGEKLDALVASLNGKMLAAREPAAPVGEVAEVTGKPCTPAKPKGLKG